MIIDERLRKLVRGDLHPIAVEVSREEEDRMVMAASFGMPFLPPIRRGTFIRFLCERCGIDFSVRADVAILGRHRCPSVICEGRRR